jgi:P-type Cu2+ transporter
LIALPAAAYAGQPFFQSAFRALRARRVNMDVPISIGVTLALALSVYETAIHAPHAYFDSAIMLLFFLLIGRYLDLATRRKTRVLAGNLASLKAEFAHRLDSNGEFTQVPVGALRPGDRVLVRPGERVPADGAVINGASGIDESLVTGETLYRPIRAGAPIYAGSINVSDVLTVRVTAAGAGTLVEEVERLLDKATQTKSQTVRLADRAARLYAPLVHATAALTAIGWLVAGASIHESVVIAIAVLIITCPCAIALAIPAVQVVAASALFRSGLILNGGDAIERFAEADTVIFDKTGTLTLPDPCVDDRTEVDPDMIEQAARLALSSRHPLATALALRARERRLYSGAIEEPGQGVRACIDGEEARLGSAKFCGVAEDERSAATQGGDASFITFAHAGKTATIAIRQALRPDAAAVTKALRERGLRLLVLSGDRPAAVAPVAHELGIEDWQAGLTPADKIAVIETLKSQGHHILMVGDGLNDAPAHAAAHVSISPITAAHLTQAHADALFLGDRLRPVLSAVVISRQARGLMKQNLALAAIYNTFAVPLAIAGLVTPLIAAVAMSGSSLLVTLNALRARFAKPREPITEERTISEAIAPLAGASAEARS